MQKTSASYQPRALLVVDVQSGFLSDYTERALPRIHGLLRSNEFDLVIATRFSNPDGSPFRRFIRWSRLSTPEEIALDPIVEEYSDIVVDKTTYGAGEEIDAILRNRGVTQVTVIGIDTDVCVLQNAAYLFDHGYEVTIDLAACATNGGPEAEAATVPLLQRTIGRDYVKPRSHDAK